MKMLKLILAGTLALGVATSTLSADAVKGQKLFIKKFKEPCGFNGAKFAAKHSQAEWEAIMKDGKFKDELIKICPNVKPEDVNDSWIQHIYDFSFEFANDSGNVPSC